MAPRIVIVDDQDAIRMFLAATLTARGYEVRTSGTGEEALNVCAEQRPDLVLLDLRLPDMDGFEVLARLKADDPAVRVVILTSYGHDDNAVQAFAQDAFDFVTKPVDLDRLLAVIRRAMVSVPVDAQARPGEHDDLFSSLPGIVPSSSEAMHVVYEQVRKIAAGGRSTVMLLGESGVGKDILAQVIHQNSSRRDYPFLDINCASLPEPLLESELFGHERGAFTDATQKKLGLLELSHAGTVFLDEIGEMPLAIQVKLLRVLEKMTFRRVGGVESIQVDVRIIAATNRDLATMVAQGRFREDLFFRLRVIQLEVPPLRRRTADIEMLATRFLQQYNEEFGKSFEGLTPAAVAALRQQRWPGNVRQLRNTIERSVLLESGTRLDAGALHLDPDPDGQGTSGDDLGAAMEAALGEPLPAEGVDLDMLVHRFEEAMIRKALAVTDGNQSHASRLLGLGRDRFRYRVKQYEL